jgi:hypothetical protein
MKFGEWRTGDTYFYQGQAYVMVGYFSGPSCIMRNTKTGQEMHFGDGGLIAEEFKTAIDHLTESLAK